METVVTKLDAKVPIQSLLGYLNFSGGKPDSRFQKQLSEAYQLITLELKRPFVPTLHSALRMRLQSLKADQASAFRESSQVEAVLRLTFEEILPGYIAHHSDLLAHQTEADLFQPFFVARVFEAVLSHGLGAKDPVDSVLLSLNDYVGHRPIAILETRPRGEPYDHERVRPIPLYIHGAGSAHGRYHALISQALEILSSVDKEILQEACLDPKLLEEIAFDPRAYDHNHPANRRPNFVFGEWDPHYLDSQGRFRRYVARQITLDALWDRWFQQGEDDEALLEAAAVFVGTMLMATGTSGNTPTCYDSSVTLSTLMPKIARYRDRYYSALLKTITAKHGEMLRKEAEITRQPFGGIRQHLNQHLARHRASQLQQRQLSVLFAEMGHAEASKQAAKKIPVLSVRFLSEILGRLATGQLFADRGDFRSAVPLATEAQDYLMRGIACGAFVDPWNILGFQCLYPLFHGREDSIRDGRIDELVVIVEQVFHLYSRLMSEASAAGEQLVMEHLRSSLTRLATWWDRFATVEVGEIRHISGAEILASSEQLCQALDEWHKGGEKPADISFWRDQMERFHSPKAFALVLDSLLRKVDYKAAMALLINWVSMADRIPLEDQEHSFHSLAPRWLLGYTGLLSGPIEPRSIVEKWPIVQKFFDYLEANAEEYWHVPRLEDRSKITDEEPREENLFDAAYEDVTYRDSTGDNDSGSVLDGSEELNDDFALEHLAEELTHRLRFLATLARLWQIAARYVRIAQHDDGHSSRSRHSSIEGWRALARANRENLLELLDSLQERRIPEPSGSYDSIVEFDRRRAVKEQMLYSVINTCLDTHLAAVMLETVAPGSTPPAPLVRRPAWDPVALELEQALLAGDASSARDLLPRLLKLFKDEPLLFPALADGGSPRFILRVRIAQGIIRSLATSLPRLGLIKETHLLLKTARLMEVAHPPGGKSITEFNHLFQAGFQAVVECLLHAAPSPQDSQQNPQEVIDLLELLTRPFLMLWIEHSQTLQLSALEAASEEADWERIRSFVKRYGRDLFTPKFMTLGNLRGILHRGVGSYLDYVRDNPDPMTPVKLIDDLAGLLPRREAEHCLGIILQSLVESYEEYKDYNTTTPHSDYGENLHVLLDFLRLKARYDRHAWRLRPLVMVHETLARSQRPDLAISWQTAFARMTLELSEQYVQKLAELEKQHGMRLRTISDRVEERFVKSFALDRLCALIEPAMAEARDGASKVAFAHLEKELEPLVATPTGVGLDVPHWLRRLESEVQRVRDNRNRLAEVVETTLGVPRSPMTMSELQEEIRPWAEEFKTDA